MKYNSFGARRFLVTLLLTLLVVIACDKKDKDDHGGGDCGPECGGPQASSLALDLSNAEGMAIVETDTSMSLLSFFLDDEKETNAGLMKITADGEIKPALVSLGKEKDGDQNNSMGPDATPRASAIGFAPTGEVYVLFEHSFMFKTPESFEGEDTHSPSSPYTCQLFKLDAKLGSAKSSSVSVDSESNLECVTTQHEIPTWRNTSVMQFDKNGIMYFPAHIPGNWKDIYYAYDPNTGELTEKVNGNIMWRDVRVSPSGSIFYTGTTSSGEGDSGGASYFRYISPDNALVEVSRDWWQYTYERSIDPANPDTENIIFYGPDPSTSTGLPSWDTACVYQYEPITGDSDRAAKCLNDIWGWIEGRGEVNDGNSEYQSAATRSLKKTRCESEGQIFVGGGGIEQLDQSSTGGVYVAGELKKKIGGTFKCNVEVSEDHCSSMLPATHTDSTSCTNAGYTWKTVEYCDCMGDTTCFEDNRTTETVCETAPNAGQWRRNNEWYNDIKTVACTSDDANWKVGWNHCEQPSSTSGGDGWTSTLKALAFLDHDPAAPSEKLLTLMSAETESIIRFWIVNDIVYYSSFENGSYYLKQAIKSGSSYSQKVLLEGYEVYNLVSDPANSSRVLFDGLYFNENIYRFGSIDPTLSSAADIAASLEVKDGLTGQVKTLIIIPDFD